MSQQQDGGQAFPVTRPYYGEGVSAKTEEGMSLRDYFAGQALAASDWTEWLSASDYKLIGARCYQLADGMIAARSGKGEQ